MRLVHRVSLAAALLAGSFVAIVSAPLATAQDTATPAPDCVATTPEENVAIVEAYITSYDNVDQAGLDAALADEYVDNIDRGAQPNDPMSNDDEHMLAQGFEASYPGSTYTINEILPLGEDRVVADLTITITHAADAEGNTVELPAPIMMDSITIATIECGEIVSARTVSDTLTLIIGLGLVISVPEATPAP